ncbi:MAG TPA: FHA domain-containing protein [Pseudobdellovibrionaceae bacterium]|nr:FHA domain-containing protein [Pseudobdellovibrionaceae bacterium]
MNVLLIIKDNAGRVLAETILSSGVSTIGRDAACTISVPHRSLSRHHAQITVNDNFVRVVDLGSRNGLYFGGERHQQIEFQENRRIDVGALNLEFQFMDQDHADVEPEQTSPGAQPSPEAEVDVRTQVGQAAKSTHESAFLARETFVGASPLAPRSPTPARTVPTPQSPSPMPAAAQPIARPSAPGAIQNPQREREDDLAFDLNAVGPNVAPSAPTAASVQPPPAPVDSPYFAAPVPPTQAVAPLPPLAPPPARPSAGTVTSYTVSKSGFEATEEAPAKAKFDLHSRSTQVMAVAIIVVITFIGLRWGTSGSKSQEPSAQSSTSSPVSPNTTEQLDQASVNPPVGTDSPSVGNQDRPRSETETRPAPSVNRDVAPQSAQNSRPSPEGPPQADGSYRYGTANEYLRHVQDFVNRPR